MVKFKWYTTFCFAVLGISAMNAQQEREVTSQISQVTVFLNKAQVTREIRANLSPGKNLLVVSGLTSMLDPESIQASGKGHFIILGVSHRQNYLSDLNLPAPLKMVKDSIEYYQRELALEQSQKEILAKEEQMLASNQKIGGANQNLSVAELKGMADFYRARLGEIVTSRMKQDEKIKRISARISRLQMQASEQNELYSRNTSEVVISVTAENATSAEITLNYVAANAGWTPQYDLRALNTKSPIQLSYKASVFQATGEEWKNVKLKLSTANPSQGGLKPELSIWNLDFYQPVVYKSKGKRALAHAPAPAAYEEAPKAKSADLDEGTYAQTTAEWVTTVQTALNVEFDIALPYTVVSASKPTVVDIRNHEMKASYEYAVAPKLDVDAFLLAKAAGWEDFNLLPGEANIFFEGTFVGKTYIDPNSTRDTLSISLGRDKRIVVKREKQKDLTSRKVIGTNQKESYVWDISIRNTKNEPIKIQVEDQIPVSLNAQIEVSATDLGGASHNTANGKLTWMLNLQPNETQKVTYKFEVKYPKDKQVIGL